MAKRILIVDDDELVLLALGELLRPQGYEVRTLSRGPEALKTLDEENFDLLILDVVMPEMSGFELCRKIREKEQYRETTIVFLTAKSRDEDRNHGLEAGANLFLSKPISPGKLLSLIAGTLG
jgi:two-component system cell cycle response regulator